MRTLVARLDSMGDVLLAGPAVRQAARHSEHVTLLCGPRGRAAAELLPGVDEVVEWHCPWIDPEPRAVDPVRVDGLVRRLASLRFDRALVLTSFHQSPLPLALLLRLAGIAWVGAISEDYPGSLLDLRHRVADGEAESERGSSLATAAGFPRDPADRGALAVRRPLPDVGDLGLPEHFVVLHPGTSVPARAWPSWRFAEVRRQLAAERMPVVVTGAPAERALTAYVAGVTACDLGGRLDLARLAAVLARADAVVVANTGPAHLAAAVGTPVVSLFAPTVAASSWAPYGVPTALLGDQHAPCRGSRATRCSYPGHPCLSSVTAAEVVSELRRWSRADRAGL